MTDIIGPEQTAAAVHLCPACGSPTIDINIIADTAKCTACIWGGSSRELLRVGFGHQLGDDARIVHLLVNDVRKLLMGAAGGAYAQFLSKWGFLSKKPTAVEFARYLQVIAEKTIQAIIEERKLQVEAAHGKSG
jgi:hypothetical protein